MSRSPILASLFVCLSLAAQPLRVNTPQPISATRTGVVTERAFNPMVASNGSSFLMAWGDDRFVVQSLGSGNQGYASCLLMRLDAEGTPLDESPIAIPFFPVGIVWNGSEWIVAGGRSLARISAEGALLEVHPIEEPNFLAQGVAWTGNALVVVGPIKKNSTDYELTGGVRSLTFDAQLQLVANAQLTDIASKMVATIGDGQSAITLWRHGRYVPDGTSMHAASFGSDGLLQQIRRQIVTGAVAYPYDSSRSIGATGKGYLVLYPDKNFVRKAVWIEPDLDSRAVTLPAGLNGLATSMAWDGTSLTLYSTDEEQHLLATGFSAEGFYNASPRMVGTMSSRYPELAAAGVPGKNVVAYAGLFESTDLKFRVLAPPAFTDSPERSPAGPGPLPQDFPAAASTSSQSLVAWRERVSPADWRIYATRLGADATVLDPDSLLLATSSCDRNGPTLATDGENYLAAWHDKDGIATAAIRADGTFTTRHSIGRRYGGPCTEAPLKLLSNGTDYLLLWVEKLSASGDQWDLFGLRLRADGSIIDTLPITVGTMTGSYPFSLRIDAASNSQDYLIAWEGAAVRLTSEGALLDTIQKIRLGQGYVLSLWWDGRTYIAQTSSNDGFRFLRIGSDGSGGRPSTGPQIDPVPFPPGVSGLYSLYSYDQPACDAKGCWLAGTSRHTDGHDTLSAIRYEDDGTQFTMQRHDVENVSYSSVCDLAPFPAMIVNAGRPAFLFLPQRMEQPFASVHRLMIAPFAVPRGRATRHP